MSFGGALAYPFKAGNLSKVLIIVLSFLVLIASIVVVAMLFQSEDITMALILSVIPIGLGYGLFVSGYSIAVIRAVMDGDELMPAPQLGRDLGRGFMTVLAAIVHAIPLVALYACIIILAGASMGAFMSGNAYSGYNSSPNGSSIFMFCGGLVVFIGLSFIFSYTYIVGMIRYAAEDSSGVLFDIGRNFSTVTSNLGFAFGLLIRQIGVGIIYGILINAISYIFQGFLINGLSGQRGLSPILIASVIGVYILVLSFNLMSQISSAHLFAGFGNDIGIGAGPMKRKHDDYSFTE